MNKNRTANKVLGLVIAAVLLLVPLGAVAETWSAPFSADAIQPISQEDTAWILAFLDETSMGLDPDEVDYRYHYDVEGMIYLNGQSWYIGRWSKEFDDHVDLVTDFLLNTETMQMYPCGYPDVGIIQWTDDSEPEGEIAGDTVEPVPYLSSKGFSLVYDAAYLAPMEYAEDRFVTVSGVPGTSFEVYLERNLSAGLFASHLAEMMDGDDGMYMQHAMANGGIIESAVVTRGDNTIFYYLLPFGADALFITAQCPAYAQGEWGARFDLMAESITF